MVLLGQEKKLMWRIWLSFQLVSFKLGKINICDTKAKKTIDRDLEILIYYFQTYSDHLYHFVIDMRYKKMLFWTNKDPAWNKFQIIYLVLSQHMRFWKTLPIAPRNRNLIKINFKHFFRPYEKIHLGIFSRF